MQRSTAKPPANIDVQHCTAAIASPQLQALRHGAGAPPMPVQLLSVPVGVDQHADS